MFVSYMYVASPGYLQVTYDMINTCSNTIMRHTMTTHNRYVSQTHVIHIRVVHVRPLARLPPGRCRIDNTM